MCFYHFLSFMASGLILARLERLMCEVEFWEVRLPVPFLLPARSEPAAVMFKMYHVAYVKSMACI